MISEKGVQDLQSELPRECMTRGILCFLHLWKCCIVSVRNYVVVHPLYPGLIPFSHEFP